MRENDHIQANYWTNYFILEYVVKGSVSQNIDPTHYSGYTLTMYKDENATQS